MATTSVYEEMVNQVKSYVLGENQCPYENNPDTTVDYLSKSTFQKAVNIGAGEPWCVGFVQYAAGETDAVKGTKNSLYKTASSQVLWQKTPENRRSSRPQIGYVAVWAKYKDGKPTGKGHVGVVTGLSSTDMTSFESREGNTSGAPGERIVNDGGGIHTKNRKIESNDPNFKLLGFINPWEATKSN